MVDMDPLFYPKSVAVIGASPDIVRDRAGFFHSLRASFKGPLYPVNPRHQEMAGLKCYASITDVPERVDYALIMLPRERVIPVLRDCVKARTRFVLIFTSGFSETGEKTLEDELLGTVRGSETRIIGPNCIGVHCSESGLVYYPPLMQKNPGNVGFFSQSGGHALNFLIRGMSLGIEFNKVVSVGNQVDLTIEDFLEYFSRDDRIKYICGYVEDIKNGERFKRIVRETVLERKKPVILWKGGRSEEGGRAIQSHTGALAVPVKMWDSAMRQLGVINAETQVEMADILMSLRMNYRPRGLNTCIAVAGGGSSVELTDALSLNGLSVPVLSGGIQEKIGTGISQVNTSTKNPIDLGMFGFAPDILVQSARFASQDPNIHVMLVCQYPEIAKFMVKDLWDASVDKMIEGLTACEKPVVMVVPRIFQDGHAVGTVRADFMRKLTAAGIPSFPTAERAARTTRKIQGYLAYLEKNRVRI